MAVKECINKIPDNVLPKEQRDEYITKIEALVKGGVDERMAGIQVIKEFHKQLHDDLNKLKEAVGVKKDKYVPFDNSKSIKSIEDEYSKLIEEKNKALSTGEQPVSSVENKPFELAVKKDNINDVPLLKNKQGVVNYIPKSIVAKAYANDSANNGKDGARPQPLERIIQRGGYSVREMDTLYPTWRKEVAELNGIKNETQTEKPIQQTMEGSGTGNEPITAEESSTTETIIPETTQAKKGNSERRQQLSKSLASLLKEKGIKYESINIGGGKKNNEPSIKIIKDEGNVYNTLKRIKGAYPEYGKLIDELMSLSDRKSLSIITRVVNPNSEARRAFYNSTSDKIFFDGNFEGNPKTIVHEVIHGMTAMKIQDLKAERLSGKSYIDSIKKSKGNSNPHVGELIKIYEEAITNSGLKEKFLGENGMANNKYSLEDPPDVLYDNYGFYNIHEFLAEAFTNPEFQAKLKNIKVGADTAWSKFVEFVKNVLGIKSRDLLEQTINIGKKIISSERGELSDAGARYFSNISERRKTIQDFINKSVKDGYSIDDIKGALEDNNIRNIDDFVYGKQNETTQADGTQQAIPTEPSEQVSVNDNTQPLAAANALQGSYDRLSEQMTAEGIDVNADPQMQAMKQKIDALQLEKTMTVKGKELADKIRSLRIQKNNKAYATIFGLPIAIYDTAIITIANAVEGGALLADAINEGIKHIKSKVKDWDDNGNFFAQHIIDFAAGEKPKLKVQVEAEKNEPEPTDEETEKQKTKEAKKGIDNYELTASDETNKFMSGETWENIFGETPEGNQNYAVQKLTDMLQDGKNMIAIAQEKWGSDIMDYGKKLFSYIQDMGKRSGNAETNKQAVLLATFLGEIKEAIVNNPDRANELRKLQSVVLDYYQHYMNVRGKEVVAGRLLRLYRDKYLGDAFADRILEQQQIDEKNAVVEAEKNVAIPDEIVAKPTPQITEEEKKKEDKAAEEKKKKSDKKQSEKKSMSQKEAQQKANDKLKEIEQKLGAEKDKGLIAKINDLINKINCP